MPTGPAVRSIGVVHNGREEAVDEGWGDVVSTIRLDSDMAGALDGLDGFSHALVLTWLHEAPREPETRRRPRGRKDMPLLGVLAQRARHRPNPIGVTAVEVLGVAGLELKVRGLDAIDGTPVLDVKPYVPAYDKRDATVPEWMDRLMDSYF